MIPDMRRPPQTVYQPTAERVTSQCLEIADWTHEDCAGGYCTCSCGHPGVREEEAG